MSETSMILCPSDTLKPAISSEAQAAKEAALAGVALIGRVTNAEQNAAAVAALAEVTKLIKLAEKSHKAVKSPYLQVCQAIDETKRNYVAELKDEELRINVLCGNWFQEEQEKIRQAERDRQAEIDRIESERQAEEQRIRDEARLKAEAEPEEVRKIIEAKAAKELAERNALAAQEVQCLAPAPTLQKTQGQAVKTVWTFEVTNIIDLARVRRDLVEMTPRTAAIKEIINLGTRKLAGIRIFEETKTSVRPGSVGKTIDV